MAAPISETKKLSWYEMVEEDERLERIARLNADGKRSADVNFTDTVQVVEDDTTHDAEDSGPTKKPRRL